MPLEPRFRRVAALSRPFVNRESALQAVSEELARIGSGPRVLNVTGVGGIGKSRLLREIRDRVTRGDHRTAMLDLQVPAHRQQAEALAVLRLQLGEQGVRFDRYDIAYAVLWQRLHPHLRISPADLPFAAQSEVLSAVADAASGVPVFGTAVHLVRLLEKARSGQRRRRQVRIDETLRQLDALPNAELVDAVTYLFAEDLRAASGERPYTVFVDAHEAMRGADDDWLRDLVVQLDRGLTVLASREPVGWSGDWESVVRTVPIEGLPMRSRLELLGEGGVSDPHEQRTIAQASEGVPFYLHLAVDTRTQGGSAGVVSGEEILRRFLHHVEREEIRFLELLSAARFFDFDIFRTVTAAFQMPGHRMAWESLTSYSFVYPAGPHYLQLHQLMAGALRERLSPELARDVHRALRRIWDEREALGEAAYHGLAAGDLTAEELLEYADRIKTSGGARGIGGLLADLRGHRGGALPDVGRCIEAEQAILLGNVERAAGLTPDEEWAVHTTVGARLAVAAGHARRIGGETAAALAIYTKVWEGAGGSCRLDAGLWAADLHMAQGRFAHARTIVGEIQADCPEGDAELRGDLARLLYLADRFSYDFEGAARRLEEATRWYEESGSVFGQSAVQTNRAELLAWTDPAAAIDAAAEAIETQRELGALHELGKAYTALAIAQGGLGRLQEAEASLDLACEVLEQARYRSGRARAELVRAFVFARRGLPERAADSARWAVDELVGSEVYPTLILLAGRLLEVLGVADEPVERAVGEAREALDFDLVDRTAERVAELLGMDPSELYRTALGHPEAAAGFYNRNVRVGEWLVRAPIHGADGMDLRIWPENELLAALGHHIESAPRIFFASADPRFQVHAFVEGTLLDDLAPRGVRVPVFVPGDVLGLFRQLVDVPFRELPPVPFDWPADGDTAAFARRLSGVTGEVYATFRDDFAELFGRLGIPRAPLAPVRWETLSSRPFCLVHSDVHRKNMILADGHTVFLDWELALWGDPLYELAVHLHKMAYFDDERDAVIRGWLQVMPRTMTRAWEADLGTYLAHERMKSAIVDTVRYTQLVRSGELRAEQERHLLEKLTHKLNAAGAYWNWPRRIAFDQVEGVISP